MRVLLSGHAFGPDRGTEPGFAWNWAWHLSREHDVWVLTHPQFRSSVEAYLRTHPNPRLHVVWVNLPAWCDPFDPERGQQWVRLHYTLWQWVALRVARRLHREYRFDIVHHVTLGTINVPPLLWRLRVPFVWGPIGGGQVCPQAFRAQFGASWVRESLRNLYVKLLPLNVVLRLTAAHSDVALATNRETQLLLRKVGARDVRMLVDGGIRPEDVPVAPPRRADRAITILWAGRIEPRKGLSLALEAFSRSDLKPGTRLIVAGDGSDLGRCTRLAQRLDIWHRVTFVGKIAWPEMPAIFRTVDIFLFTSLQDSFGSVLLEAMGQALPVIALNHQGPAAFLPDKTCIKVELASPAATICGLAKAIAELEVSQEKRETLGRAAWEFARKHTWDRRADQMSKTYRALVDREIPTAMTLFSVPSEPSN